MNIQEAVVNDKFSHYRSGNGCWRKLVLIYHRDETSPTGYMMVASGNRDEVLEVLKKEGKA